MSEPELSPEEETRVRGLLAGARYDAPVPDDVAARLDRVLAGLAAERDGGAEGSAEAAVGAPTDGVDELAARRRRRGAWLLGAAACLVVGTVGVGQVLSSSGGDLASSDSSAGEAGQELASDGGADAETREELAGSAESGGAPVGPVQPAPTPTSSIPVRIEEGRFARDAARILDAGSLSPLRSGGKRATKERQLAPTAAAAWFSCEPAAWGPGRLVAVEYAGEPAVLAFRTPAGDSRVVDLLECGTGTVLRSVTLPVS